MKWKYKYFLEIKQGNSKIELATVSDQSQANVLEEYYSRVYGDREKYCVTVKQYRKSEKEIQF